MSDRLAAAQTAPAEGPGGTPGHFLEAADRIGCELCRNTLWAGNRCNWLGWTVEFTGSRFEPLYAALPPWQYNGVAGIALFLAHLTRRTHDPDQEATLRGAIEQLLHAAESGPRDDCGGYFTGSAGVGHTLFLVGRLLGDDILSEKGLAILERACDLVESSSLTDVMSGEAGTIPILLDVVARSGRESLLERAFRQGKNLLGAGIESAAGFSWPGPENSPQHLTGYSHGAAGNALALLELHGAVGDAAFLSAAQGGFRYERSLYDSVAENWPDFRIDPGTPSSEAKFAVAWCNGAVGIGLSRLRAMEILPQDPALILEVEAGLRTTMRSLTVARPLDQIDFTLCHGIAGAADFVLQTGEQFHRPDLSGLIRTMALQAVETYQRASLPWGSGVQGRGENPSLMLGNAGIGYLFLRCSDPAAYPSILIPRPAPLGGSSLTVRNSSAQHPPTPAP